MKFIRYSTFIFLMTPVMFLANSFAEKLPRGAKELISFDIPSPEDLITDLKYSPDGTRLAVATAKGFWIYDANKHKELFSYFIDDDDILRQIQAIVFSPDGKLFASGENDKTLLWDVKTGKNLQTLETKHLGETLAFHPDSKTLASAGSIGIRLWNIETGIELSAPLKGHKDAPSALAFSTDGRTLISASTDGTLRLWDVKTGNPPRIFEVPFSNIPGSPQRNGLPKYTVPAWAFSGGSKMLASGAFNVHLWNTDTGRKVTSLPTKENLRALVFSPDGKKLASGDIKGTIQLWNIKTERKLSNRLVGGIVLALAFSPDSKTLVCGVAGGGKSSVLLWDVDKITSTGARR